MKVNLLKIFWDWYYDFGLGDDMVAQNKMNIA